MKNTKEKSKEEMEKVALEIATNIEFELKLRELVGITAKTLPFEELVLDYISNMIKKEDASIGEFVLAVREFFYIFVLKKPEVEIKEDKIRYNALLSIGIEEICNCLRKRAEEIKFRLGD